MKRLVLAFLAGVLLVAGIATAQNANSPSRTPLYRTGTFTPSVTFGGAAALSDTTVTDTASFQIAGCYET